MSTSKRTPVRKAAGARKATLAPVADPTPTEAPADHPGRSPRIERWLSDRRADFTFEVHPLQDFDVTKSLQNQARFEALKKEKVEEYRLAMDRGELLEFPALVAYWDGRKLVVIDGNHRLNAAVAYGAAEMPVYVVDAPDEIVRVLTYQANRIFNGFPTSVEERTENAIHLVDMGMTTQDAAAALGLSGHAVQTAISRSRADRRAAKLGLTKGWQKLGVTIKTRLHAVLTDEGFAEAAKVAIEAQLTGNEVGELVSAVNQSRSASGQIETADEYRAKYKGRIQKGAVGLAKQEQRGLTTFNRFLGTLTILENYKKDDVAKTSQLADLSPGELTSRCMDAAEHLMQIAEAVEASAREDNGEKASA